MTDFKLFIFPVRCSNSLPGCRIECKKFSNTAAWILFTSLKPRLSTGFIISEGKIVKGGDYQNRIQSKPYSTLANIDFLNRRTYSLILNTWFLSNQEFSLNSKRVNGQRAYGVQHFCFLEQMMHVFYGYKKHTPLKSPPI